MKGFTKQRNIRILLVSLSPALSVLDDVVKLKVLERLEVISDD